MNITPAQLRRVQVLYAQYARHSLDIENTREGRLAFASSRTGRAIDSFSQLTIDEAIQLIDGLQRALGVAVPSKTPRRRQTRKDAEKAATEGRHDQIHDETTLVSESDLRRIQRLVEALGWDQARLDGFLRSPRGPNQGRTAIRTLGDANRVAWALKRIRNRAQKAQTKPQEEAHAEAVQA